VTSQDTPAQLTIEFAGQIMPVVMPDESQLAVLIANQEFWRRQRRRMDSIGPELDALGDTGDANHPLRVEAEKLSEEGIRHVGRFQTVLKTLFANPDDWDFIQDGLADKTIVWQQVADIPALVIEARNARDAVEPTNREGRRAAKKAAGRLAR
jgi:hypothetical protein